MSHFLDRLKYFSNPRESFAGVDVVFVPPNVEVPAEMLEAAAKAGAVRIDGQDLGNLDDRPGRRLLLEHQVGMPRVDERRALLVEGEQ